MDPSSQYYSPARQDSAPQQPQPQSSQWLTPLQTSSPYASPTATSPSLDPSYAAIFGGPNSDQNGRAGAGLPRSGSSLSLNMSGLSVASPSLSPSGVGGISSPITPLTPAQQQHQQQQHQGPFRYSAPDQPTNDNPNNSLYPTRPPGSSRSSTSSNPGPAHATTSTTPLTSPSHPNPRKRTLTLDPPPITIPTIYDPSPHSSHSHYEENEMNYGLSAGGMDMDDSPTSTGFPDLHGGPMSGGGSGGGGAGMAHKGMGTNNFVSKLYQMISDPKSARFITWTEHGTSFVVQNVGEFSRTILGAHFKHNNFSSFVRQLNMYGFSKINRTPRAQRTSSSDQTWEFAHAKFLRGRPDLLEEIRRKALEPDPTIKQRVELPGELASQLTYIREENRRVSRALEKEQDRTRRLAEVVRGLWDVVGRGFPGELLPAFPADLLDVSPISAHADERGDDGPPIYITSPVSNSSHHYSTPAAMEPMYHQHQMHHMSPASSPTATDFPHQLGGGGGPSPTRGLSLPHIVTTPQQTAPVGGGHQRLNSLGGMYDAPSSPSPISGPEDDGGGNWGSGDISQQRVKRQRTTPSPHPHPHPHPHPNSQTHLNANHNRGRARSDSTPGTLTPNTNTWVRPRSGSGLGLVGGVSPTFNGGGGGGGLMGLGLGLGNVSPSAREGERNGDVNNP